MTIGVPIEDEIDALAKEFIEYKIIQSIPSIGEKIAATIISEIGEIDRFHHPKKLVAFAGIDPSIFESGRFKGRTVNRITKQKEGLVGLGVPYIWQLNVPFVIVGKRKRPKKSSRATRGYENSMIKKREEGKLYKVAVIACANKLLQWIYALLKTN